MSKSKVSNLTDLFEGHLKEKRPSRDTYNIIGAPSPTSVSNMLSPTGKGKKRKDSESKESKDEDDTPPKAKRGRTKKRSLNPQEEDAKKELRREQNRRAAQTSREKKQLMLSDLEAKVQTLMEERKNLEATVKALKEENEQLYTETQRRLSPPSSPLNSPMLLRPLTPPMSDISSLPGGILSTPPVIVQNASPFRSTRPTPRSAAPAVLDLVTSVNARTPAPVLPLTPNSASVSVASSVSPVEMNTTVPKTEDAFEYAELVSPSSRASPVLDSVANHSRGLTRPAVTGRRMRRTHSLMSLLPLLTMIAAASAPPTPVSSQPLPTSPTSSNATPLSPQSLRIYRGKTCPQPLRSPRSLTSGVSWRSKGYHSRTLDSKRQAVFRNMLHHLARIKIVSTSDKKCRRL